MMNQFNKERLKSVCNQNYKNIVNMAKVRHFADGA